MMNIKISKKRVLLLLYVFLVTIIIVFPIMIHFFNISGDIIPIIQSQLSFSGRFLKDQYLIIINSGGLTYYRTAQFLDYGFMISYGGIFFSLVCLVGINAEADSFWEKTRGMFSIMSIGAILFDALENVFILMTLSNPQNFPDIWAIVHSTFALVKCILLITVLLWILSGFIVNLNKKIKERKERK
ncbi:MAG: hypothetical protein ACTSXK_12605 [Promethearchaeota archaeon]